MARRHWLKQRNLLDINNPPLLKEFERSFESVIISARGQVIRQYPAGASLNSAETSSNGMTQKPGALAQNKVKSKKGHRRILDQIYGRKK